MPRKPAFRHEAHVFKPPQPLVIVGKDRRLLDKMWRSVEGMDLSSPGRLTPRELRSMHPLILEQLIQTADRPELARHREAIRISRELAGIPVRGLRFMPAEISLHPVIKTRLLDSYDREAMFPVDLPPEEQIKSSLYNKGVLGAHVRFMPEGAHDYQYPQMVAHIDMPEPGTFVVGPYGMKGSLEPRLVPKFLQQHYLPGAAPSLGLALILNRLREIGAERVIIPGDTYMHETVGAKQWQIRHNVKAIADGSMVPSGADRAKAAELARGTLRDWDKLPASEVHGRLRRMGMSSFIRSLALNPGVIHRYYRDVPSRFGAEAVEYPQGYRNAHLFTQRHLDTLKPLSTFMERKKRG